MLSNREEAPVLRNSVDLPTSGQKPLGHGRSPRWVQSVASPSSSPIRWQDQYQFAFISRSQTTPRNCQNRSHDAQLDTPDRRPLCRGESIKKNRAAMITPHKC